MWFKASLLRHSRCSACSPSFGRFFELFEDDSPKTSLTGGAHRCSALTAEDVADFTENDIHPGFQLGPGDADGLALVHCSWASSCGGLMKVLRVRIDVRLQ